VSINPIFEIITIKLKSQTQYDIIKKIHFETGCIFMTVKLFFQTVLKFVSGIVLVGLLVFLPAGTLNYFGGWLFMAVLFIPMFIAGIIMMLLNPSLLKKRLDAKEEQAEQNLVVKLSGLMFIAGFIVAGLDFRFARSTLPKGVIIGAAVAFLVGYILYGEVMRENTYLSRIIQVEKNQKVIDTGLYSIVRHPMYSATLLMFMTIPLILGSAYSFIIFLTYPIIIAKRIKNEEALLEKELDGYREYKEKVKYCLVPFIW